MTSDRQIEANRRNARRNPRLRAALWRKYQILFALQCLQRRKHCEIMSRPRHRSPD